MGLVSFCSAKPEFYDQFLETYAPQTAVTFAKCTICHTSEPARNAYGKQLKDAMNGPDISSALKAIEAMDADGDGSSNLDEIKADTLPGDPKSHPAQSAPTKPIPTESAFFPKHSFHPVVVHFPIGLFLFGVFLEFFGWRRGDPNLRYAAMICLLGGGLSSYGAVITGLLFFFRSGFSWSGMPLNHLISGIAATLLMTGVVFWRAKGANESKVYFVVLAVAGALVGFTGHLGGLMVYG